MLRSIYKSSVEFTPHISQNKANFLFHNLFVLPWLVWYIIDIEHYFFQNGSHQKGMLKYDEKASNRN